MITDDENECHDIELAAEQFLIAYLAEDPKVGFLAFQLQAVLSFVRKRRKEREDAEEPKSKEPEE